MDKGKSIITELEGDDERIPPGYRFVPTDTELVVHYLYNKVYHKPLPGNMIIAINIYDFHPQQLARYKMSLDFYEGGPRDGRKTEWKMHEYKILPTRKSNATDSMKLDDLVLSKIYSTSKKAKDVQQNQRTELAAENAIQDSRPLGVSNGMNMGPSMSFSEFSGVQVSNPSLPSGGNDQLNNLMYLEGAINGSSHDNCPSSLGAHMMNIEERSSPNLLPHNSDFLFKPLDGHHMPLVGPSMSFSEFSGVQVSNPSLPSGGNDQLNNLMYLEGAINGSSHDNCPSSLGAHMMNIEERSSPNLLPHNSERHRFMLEPVYDHTSPLTDRSMSFSELSEVQIPNLSLLSSCDSDQLMNDLMYLEGVLNDSSHDNCPSSLVPI
ncbi:hypothetical protein Acr_11g0005280 [Actinidia rufa]|uniref:NAC domain-containing protein n=1 Tax=Actinidia rufa TaxID=165716 RepID=A0A7J0FBZ3_9ERIC|nr:hypothetical protein Acr_11g0005280 [Actinidia rufa]